MSRKRPWIWLRTSVGPERGQSDTALKQDQHRGTRFNLFVALIVCLNHFRYTFGRLLARGIPILCTQSFAPNPFHPILFTQSFPFLAVPRGLLLPLISHGSLLAPGKTRPSSPLHAADSPTCFYYLDVNLRL